MEMAYFNDIMESKELRQAQINEAFIKALHQMICFERANLKAQLDMLLDNPHDLYGT